MEFFAEYGLFLAKLLTATAVIVVGFALLVGIGRRGGHGEGLEVRHLNARLEEQADVLRHAMHGKRELKKLLKGRAKTRKRDKGARLERPRVFVLDFKGDLRASAGQSLRHEVSAVLAVAGEHDQVLLRLENAGGTVHDHGFAASQLERLKRRGIPLTVAVDKVAASGGYLMACVAERIIAAPFAAIATVGWTFEYFQGDRAV